MLGSCVSHFVVFDHAFCLANEHSGIKIISVFPQEQSAESSHSGCNVCMLLSAQTPKSSFYINIVLTQFETV